jgi:phenylalanine-4-hydroxylase
MAQIRNLWWTVEYGLIELLKILKFMVLDFVSIGESAHCMTDQVEKFV